MAEEVKKIGNLFLVDPNPPERGKIPDEDLFIYISLIARSKHRGVGVGLSKKEKGKIRFISTTKGPNWDPDKGEKRSYATTDYTNIGGMASQNSEGMLEGFGIQNIQIKYSASLVPRVDIQFVDLRGASLFDVLQDDSQNLTYGVFFQLPYPIFELKLKGYFGNTITYCLHMLSWTSKFDSSTGNFIIDAKFVGFQQAFLADMTLGNVIGTVNTTKGRLALNNIKIKINDDPKDDVDTPALDDFLIQIAQIEAAFTSLKANDSDYDQFKNLTDLKAKLNKIQELIGKPMKKEEEGYDEDVAPNRQKNDSDELTTAPINEDDLKMNIDYLSIRDWIIIKESVSKMPAPYFGEFLNTLHELVKDYAIFVAKNQGKFLNITTAELDISNVEAFALFLEEPQTNGKPSRYYNFIGGAIPEYPEGSPFKLSAIPEKWGDVKDSMQDIDRYGRQLISPPIRNATFQPVKLLTQQDGNNPGYFEGVQKQFSVSDDLKVFIYDFSEMREKISTLLWMVEKKRVTESLALEKKLNDKLKESTGFNPNIKYIFSIICNNVQAMLKTIYDVSLDAHNKKEERSKELKKYTTDLPKKPPTDGDPIVAMGSKEVQSYPWPSIYIKGKNETIEEAWIGDPQFNLTPRYFPEIGFIEEFLRNYVIKKADVTKATKAGRKIASSGKDTDNWFPINPLDYRDNPYFDLITATDINIIKKNISETLCLRALISKNYSNYDAATLKNLAILEGINAYKTMFSNDGSKLLLTKLINESNLDPDTLISDLINDGMLIESGTEYILQEPTGVNSREYKLSGHRISGYRDREATFILIGSQGGTADIWDNAKQLWPAIPETGAYKYLIKTPPENLKNPYLYNRFNNNVQQLSYKVWKKDINTKLTSDPKKDLKFFKIVDIDIIDGTPDARKYINILRSQNLSITNWEVQKFLTNSELWKKQISDKSQALLLLNTLPFDTFDNTIKEIILKTEFNYGKIIVLPALYLYWIGGTLWRYNEYLKSPLTGDDADPIKWGDNNITRQFFFPPSHYLYNIGNPTSKAYAKDDSEIGESLQKLPTQVKNSLIKYFTSWVTDGSYQGFSSFKHKVVTYSEAEEEKTIEREGKALIKLLSLVVNVVLPAPNIFDPITFEDGLRIPIAELKDFFTEFFHNYHVQNVVFEKEKEKLKKEAKEIVKDKKIKLSVYNYFKNIYNKWVGGTTGEDDLVYNACGEKGKDLISYFQFINRSWGDIGDTAVVNLKSLSTLGQDMDTNIYFLLSKILRDNKFLFQILPNFVNFKDEEDVKQMFYPQVTLEETSNSGPTYVCIYAGGQSESVSIEKIERTYEYPNDSFMIMDQTPAEFAEPNKTLNGTASAAEDKATLNMVAFRVAFGSENQSIFKDISLDQSEFRETGEYFRVLSDLIDKRGKTQRVFTGTDLLKVFKTRAYKCSVEALGCMSIQPLMYFQLDNVPFFAGTYLITEVNHSINGNHMTTNFSGLRQSEFTTPIVDKYTSFLGLDFDEVTEQPLELTNLNDKFGDEAKVGVEKDFAGEAFNHKTEDGESGFGKEEMLELDSRIEAKAVGELFALVDGASLTPKTYFESTLNHFGIKTNAQVSIFLSQILLNSNYLKLNSNTLFSQSQTKSGKVWPGTSDDQLIPSNNPQWYIDKGYITSTSDEEQWIKLYRYRERGYLNLLSETNYDAFVKNAKVKEIYGKTGFSDIKSDFILQPTALDDPINSLIIAAYIFTTKKLDEAKLPESYKTYADEIHKTCNKLAEPGSASYYELITQILADNEIPKLTKSNKIFKKVLSKLNLLSYTNISI